MTNFPHFDVKKSIIKKFFLAHQEKFGKYDLKNSFGKYYISSIVFCMPYFPNQFSRIKVQNIFAGNVVTSQSCLYRAWPPPRAPLVQTKQLNWASPLWKYRHCTVDTDKLKCLPLRNGFLGCGILMIIGSGSVYISKNFSAAEAGMSKYRAKYSWKWSASAAKCRSVLWSQYIV